MNDIMNPFRLILCTVLAVLPHAHGQDIEPAINEQAESSSYVLTANDVVQLAVFKEPDLTVQTKILQSGEVVLPLVGVVKVGGLSISEATRKVRDLYAADYLVDPKVALTVEQYAVHQVSVLGAVTSPGQIPIPASGKLDVAAALASAGGLTENADPERITLVRADGSSSHLSRGGIERGNPVQLSAGDRLIVSESRYLNQSVTFVGEVRNRGLVSFPVDGDLDLVTAISQAGGLTGLANPRKVSVNRKGRVTVIDVREMSERGEQLFQLEPNDIITVPERLF
ncbi:MAG: polysaccharide biosynthesis/export family protein [Luteolibacter sp.]